MMPRRQPLARRCRASARVSTPAMAGIAASRSSVASWRASSSTAAVALADHERPQPRLIGLVVVREPAVVADQRIGHDHDLAGVRGVGADLLVAGLAGVDDEVAAGRDGRPERDAREDGAVLQRQQRRTQVADPRDRRRRSAGVRRHGSRDHAAPDTTTHRPRGRGGRGACADIEPPSPASRDRYASLTGPAMKGRRQGSIPADGPAAPSHPAGRRAISKRSWRGPLSRVVSAFPGPGRSSSVLGR